MPVIASLIFIAAAALEVAGDAMVRKGLRSNGLLFVAAGFVALGCYGLVVNLVRREFYRSLEYKVENVISMGKRLRPDQRLR